MRVAARRSRRAATVGLIAALTLSACGGSADEGPLIATVAGVADGDITQSDFQRRVDAQLRAGLRRGLDAPDPPTYRRCIAGTRRELSAAKASHGAGAQVFTTAQLRHGCRKSYERMRQETLQLLIETIWIRQEAADRHIRVTAADLARQRAQEEKMKGVKTVAQYLQRSGSTKADFDELVEAHALAKKIGAAAVAHPREPTAKQIALVRSRLPERLVGPERRDVEMVVTSTGAAAKQAERRLSRGEPFASVARELSVDRATRASGGLLRGYAVGSSRDHGFDQEVAIAPRGQLVGPIITSRGYILFRVSRIEPGKPLPPAQAVARARQLLLAGERSAALSALKAKLTRKWKPRTSCVTRLRIPDCRGVPASPPPTQRTSGQ